MNKTERAWLAGIIDGEGSISISDHRKKGRWFRLDLDVGMTHRETIYRIQTLTGRGNIDLREPKKEEHSQCWIWRVSGPDAQAILKEIKPYLVTKRDHAETALEFPLPPKLTPQEISLGKSVSKALRGIQEIVYYRMRILNA
jgi:hypothetical protein